MRRTYCWACTVLGTIAAFSIIALFARPAAPVLALAVQSLTNFAG